MKQIVTRGIVLSRVNYSEADRIITVLTDTAGKVRLLAKGVRKIKSKLAGGVELFSIASLTYIDGRGDVKTLVSSRLQSHYGRIVTDLERTQFAYEAMKTLNKVVEANVEQDYFELLSQTLAALDDLSCSRNLISVWFYVQLMRLGGHSPNLRTDIQGKPLVAATGFEFSFDDMAFSSGERGPFTTEHIKVLRLCQNASSVDKLQAVTIPEELSIGLVQLTKMIFAQTNR